jgi:DNA repair protein RadC
VFEAIFDGRETEALAVLCLNTKNSVMGSDVVYTGNISVNLVRVGELFRTAVRLNASAIIIGHNHPSGDPSPSPDDLHLTNQAIAAGKLLDITVLDHIIVGEQSYVSLRDRGVEFGGR